MTLEAWATEQRDTLERLYFEAETALCAVVIVDGRATYVQGGGFVSREAVCELAKAVTVLRRRLGKSAADRILSRVINGSGS
jgi:hypothetical protein